jgi:metacaspase-1
MWRNTMARCRKYKGTQGGLAVQFGACKDSQTAADTAALSGGTSTGAATFLFIKAIEDLVAQRAPITCVLSLLISQRTNDV